MPKAKTMETFTDKVARLGLSNEMLIDQSDYSLWI